MMSAGLMTLALLGSMSVSRAADENIEVQAVRSQKVGTYRDLAKLFRRFDRFPPAARADLSLHMLGWIDPGKLLPSEAHLTIRSKDGNIALFKDDDRDMHLPLTDALWAENPPIFQTLPAGQTISMGFVLKVGLPEGTASFTKEDAKHWMQEIDNCIENMVGVVISWFMPDAHRLRIEIMPGANFVADSGGSVQVLLENGGDVPKTYVLRPQDFPRGTIFRSNQPFGWVSVKIPGNPQITVMPDK